LSLTPTSQSPAAERATPSPQQIVRRQRQALLLALIGVLIFGLTLPATRMAVADFTPAFVMIGRALVAAALAALTLLWARPTPPRREDWPRLAWFALFSIIGFPLLMNTAMQHAPACIRKLAFITVYGQMQKPETKNDGPEKYQASNEIKN